MNPHPEVIALNPPPDLTLGQVDILSDGLLASQLQLAGCGLAI